MLRKQIAIAALFALITSAWARTPDTDFAAAERLFRLDNYAKARPLWIRAEAEFSARHDEVKATFARVSRLRGDSETILSYPAVSQEMARLLETPLVRTNPELRLRCLVVKGAADLSSKDPQSSGKVFDEAFQVAESLNDRFWIGRISGERSITAFLRGDTAKAVELNARAFAIAESLKDVQGEIRAKSLDGVGLLEQQRFDDALIRFDEALNFARSEPDVRFPLMAYMGKSEALQAQGKQQESDALLQQALKYVEDSNIQVYKADLLLELAGRAAKEKRIAAAQSLLQQAAAASKSAGMPRPYAQAELLRTQLYVAAGDFPHAESSINECISASRKLVDMYFLPQHLALAAEIETHLNRISQANQDYEEAENMVETMLLNVPSASVKASLIATMDAVFRGHFKLALERENQIYSAWRIVERVRGRVVADNLRARPQGAESGETLRLYQELNQLQGELFRTTDISQRRQLSSRIQRTEEDLDATTLSQNRERFSIHGKPVDLTTLQRLLEPDEAVFEYVMDDPRSYALVVTNSAVRKYELAGRSIVQKAITKYVGDMEAMRDSPSAKLLYSQLFAPIAEFGQKSQIVIVPDGELGFIPFDALIDPDGKYVVQSHVISCVPSATVLALLRSTRPWNGPATLLAVGSSNDADSKSRSFGRAAHGLFDPEHAEIIGSLPSVDTEVQDVSGVFGTGSEVLLGQNASESAFKRRRLDQYRVIHIASHGFADLKFPDRSGLFLGFDHLTKDDGLLQIREIRDLRLRADLVTLSACDAGAGKLEGQNGVASVVQAFLFAGARSVVASLWIADDTFTAALMARFYKGLATGMPVGSALRSAKLEMIDRFGSKAAPLLWAGFFVTGDSATHILLNKRNDQYKSVNRYTP